MKVVTLISSTQWIFLFSESTADPFASLHENISEMQPQCVKRRYHCFLIVCVQIHCSGVVVDYLLCMLFHLQA